MCPIIASEIKHKLKVGLKMSIFESKDAKRIIKKGIQEAVNELNNTPRHKLDKSNPNHPDYDNKLFGYNEKDFLNKQYK